MENIDTNYCYYSVLPSPMTYMDFDKEKPLVLNRADIDRIIEMA